MCKGKGSSNRLKIHSRTNNKRDLMASFSTMNINQNLICHIFEGCFYRMRDIVQAFTEDCNIEDNKISSN